MDNYDDNDYDDDYDPATYKFGADELVAAYKNPDRVQQLVDAGHVVTANAIQAACHTGNERTLAILLSVKGDSDIRLAGADPQNTGVDPGWAASDLNPHFGVDEREWYPLQLAANGPLLSYYGGKRASDAVQNELLRHKISFFAVFKQPIWRPDPFPFPGELDSEVEDGESETSEESIDYMHSLDMVGGKWQHEPKPEFGYGLRCVLHSLLEDGAYVKPLFEHPDLVIDLSHRDPQGRTLLLSACRNAVGADATTSVAIQDINGEDARNKLKSFIAPEASETSLFHTLRKRKANIKGSADLKSKDFSGKNILHHLLEARTPSSKRLPLIRNTLRWVLKHEPQLVNSVDKYGTYPLHTALQRLRGQLADIPWHEDSPLEAIVHDLLDAGADATVRDSRGNTGLHYLADNGLAEQIRGVEARALCQRFCDAGVDVNVRNKQGRTALEILMSDDGTMFKALWNSNPGQKMPPLPLEQIDAEVFAMFDRAGALWKEQDLLGQTLLHLVAKYPTRKTAFRVKYLLERGVDLGVKDREGKRAIDIAREFDNKAALEAIQSTS
jgi:ankyrin repeat protein